MKRRTFTLIALVFVLTPGWQAQAQDAKAPYPTHGPS